MSHTPLDGPDGGSPEGETPAEETQDDDFSGFVGRVRRALGRTGEALRRLVGSDRREEPEADDDPEPARPLERSIATADRETARDRPVLADRDDRPVPDRTDREPRNRPELVARWHDGRLTLSEPDEAGAQISSDTWAEVDP